MTTKAKAAPKKKGGGKGQLTSALAKFGAPQMQVSQRALNAAVGAALNKKGNGNGNGKAKGNGMSKREFVQANLQHVPGAGPDKVPLGSLFDGFHPANATTTRPRMRYDKSLHIPTIGYDQFNVPAGSKALVVFSPPQFKVIESPNAHHNVGNITNLAEGSRRTVICPLTALVFIMTETEIQELMAGGMDSGIEATVAVTLTTLGTCGASDLSIDRLSLSLRNTTPEIERGGTIKSLRANGPLALELADTQASLVQASWMSPDFGYLVSRKSIAMTMNSVATHPLRSMYSGSDLAVAAKINSRPLDPVECDQFYPLSSTSSGNVPMYVVTNTADVDQPFPWPGDVKGYTGAFIRNIGAFHNPTHAGAAHLNLPAGATGWEYWKGQAYNYGDPAWTPIVLLIEGGTKNQSYELTCKGGLSAHFQQSSFLAPMQKPRKIITSDAAASANAMEGSRESTLAPVQNRAEADRTRGGFWNSWSHLDPREMVGDAVVGYVQNHPQQALGLARTGLRMALGSFGKP